MNRLLVFLMCLLPLLILIILGESFGISPFFVRLILLLLFLLLDLGYGRWQLQPRRRKKEESISDERTRSLANDPQTFLAVKAWKAIGNIVQFEGSLLSSPPALIN